MPFITKPGVLIDATREALQEICHIEPELSTTGGTSDTRVIAPYGVEVIELGPINATIHQINECIDLNDPPHLISIFNLIY